MYYGEIRLYTEPNGAYTIVNGRIWTPYFPCFPVVSRRTSTTWERVNDQWASIHWTYLYLLAVQNNAHSNIYHQQQQIIAQQQLELTEQQTALGAQQQALLEEQRQAHDNEIIEMMIENMLDVIAE
ncbi:unnamed protein product [Rotaria socialis]|uniref:Uncharacterized protein n=1 Tax=Rotaria socialis TaxID=392032 RepID=A0A817WGS2_9BILA|nr:unnamed protein product [Rotaria socialis]